VRAKFVVDPAQIPDYLALVGDSADGYPGIPRIGPKGAVALLTRYGRIESFPAEVLGERQGLALLFKTLATLRTDANLFADIAELEWAGPTAAFAAYCKKIGTPGLVDRAENALSLRSQRSSQQTLAESARVQRVVR
jgi:5'-3' exonuclease